MIDEKVLVERLEEQRGHICHYMPCNGCKYIGDCNDRDHAEDVALDKAIEIVNQLAEESNKRYEPTIDLIEHGVEGYNLHLKEQYRMGYEDGAESVRAMLPYEEHNGWIPCERELPEKYTPVLVLLNNEEMCVFTLETDFEDTKIMYWEDWYGYHKKISETVAWQPLPAPYKPDHK